MHNFRKKRTFKKRKGKKGKGGFLMDRVVNLGSATQTFCCDKSPGAAFGDNLVGVNCKPSYSGQCTPIDYKYRCYNYDANMDHKTIDVNKPGKESCEYISGMAGRIGQTALSSAIAIAPGFSRGNYGGRKNKTKRRTKRH
jgi:hypothetical protein